MLDHFGALTYGMPGGRANIQYRKNQANWLDDPGTGTLTAAVGVLHSANC